jgi:hypothetical protein
MMHRIWIFAWLLSLSSCTFFYVGKERASKDVKAYLEAKYQEPFDIIHSQWVCNEGNGCPDYYLLTCRPKQNRYAVFQVGTRYQGWQKKPLTNDDGYRSGVLDGIFAMELDSLIRSKYPFIKKFVPVMYIGYSFNYAPKQYTVEEIKNGKFFKEQITEISYGMDLYIYHELTKHEAAYMQLLKELFIMQANKNMEYINIQMFFYRESYYQHTSLDSLDRIQRDFDIGTDIKNKHLQYKWSISSIRESYPTCIANFEEELEKIDKRHLYDKGD